MVQNGKGEGASQVLPLVQKGEGGGALKVSVVLKGGVTKYFE